MHRLRCTVALLAAAALAACGEDGIQELAAPAPVARVKFFNFGVNTPGVNFYANDTKVTAVSSTSIRPLPAPPADSLCQSVGVETATGVAQGGAASGGFYVGLAPAQYTLTARISATVDRNLPIASVPLTVAEGKSYSYFVSGIYNTTTKRADAFVLEDDYPAAPAVDTVYVRFVNAIPNAGPLTLFFRNPVTLAEGPVATAVAYRAGSAFVALPLSSTAVGSVDLVVRSPGSTAVAITRTGISISPQRVYTITARGDFTVSATGTSANRPQLDLTANR